MHSRKHSRDLMRVLHAALATGLAGTWASGRIDKQTRLSISRTLSRVLADMAVYIGGTRGMVRDEIPPSESALCAVHPQKVNGSAVTSANVAVLARPLVCRRLMRIVGMWADVDIGQNADLEIVARLSILRRTVVVMSDATMPIVTWPHNVNVGCLRALGEEMRLWTPI